MKANKIKATTSNKVNGKLVKYEKGDCLSIYHIDKYLAVLVTDKFNKFYDFTLLEYYSQNKPSLKDFSEGRFFGTRFGSWEELTFGVDKRMIEFKYVDKNLNIESIGQIELISPLDRASYDYIKDIDELYTYYLEELPIRIEKTYNAEKYPNVAFASKHLVEVRNISSLLNI